MIKSNTLAKIGDTWETPGWLFARLDREFGFKLDAAAAPYNAKLDRYCVDGLADDWEDPTYCNPPYSRPGDWVAKAATEAERGITSVLLIPASTGTGWWFDYVVKADEIRFLRGRLKYEKAGIPHYPARFDSAIVVFRPPTARGWGSGPRVLWVDYKPETVKPKMEATA